mmetsp:Transcript_32644/g.83235  ORF Transcript_32644/g.83235 Transcript_32644/m.83235 type:complete len:211 (-) Transcript_32644:550-1182(-)
MQHAIMPVTTAASPAASTCPSNGLVATATPAGSACRGSQPLPNAQTLTQTRCRVTWPGAFTAAETGRGPGTSFSSAGQWCSGTPIVAGFPGELSSVYQSALAKQDCDCRRGSRRRSTAEVGRACASSGKRRSDWLIADLGTSALPPKGTTGGGLGRSSSTPRGMCTSMALASTCRAQHIQPPSFAVSLWVTSVSLAVYRMHLPSSFTCVL